MGTSDYLYDMVIYDDKGRIIQAKSTNTTGGTDNKISPSIILKVTAGDKFNLRASSWYKTSSTSPNFPNFMAIRHLEPGERLGKP